MLVRQQPRQLGLHTRQRLGNNLVPASARTGSVLMNGPGTLPAPVPACIRPSSTVPNTTSSRPDAAPSTRPTPGAR